MLEGIIIKGIGGFYFVKTDEGLYECRARGIFRKNEKTPLPGDRVKITILNKEKLLGNIDKIFPRELELIRPAVSNINQVAMIISLNSPTPDLLLLDKLLVTTQKKKIDIIICINKTDIDSNLESNRCKSIYTNAGFNVLLLSAIENKGILDLQSILKDKITVLSGQSGVGKSTILNKVLKTESMKVGSLSERIDRGKNTTRHTELIALLDGGYIIDAPGFSSFELSDILQNSLKYYYPEFEEYNNLCKFIGCNHVNEPVCAVKEALAEGKIDDNRYKRYIAIFNSLPKISKERKKEKEKIEERKKYD